MYGKSNGQIKPPCRTSRCPIVDIAGSKSLNAKVNAFLQSESLEFSPAYAKVQERMLQEAGLLDESPETLLTLKSVLAEYREWDNKRRKKGK